MGLAEHRALVVCRHFHRLAESRETNSLFQYFLTGHSRELSENDTKRPAGLNTTALHESVLASNYTVVEYLVRTDFVVHAINALGETALDLALRIDSQHRASPNGPDTGSWASNKQIIALLRQNKNLDVERALPDLPLGWEPVQFDAERTVYRDTTLDSDIEALTFIKPRYGLLEDQKLILGQRRIEGSGQTYYLDPLRFMRTKDAENVSLATAPEPTYSNTWYQNEAREVADPATDAAGHRTSFEVLQAQLFKAFNEISMAILSYLYGLLPVSIIILICFPALYLAKREQLLVYYWWAFGNPR